MYVVTMYALRIINTVYGIKVYKYSKIPIMPFWKIDDLQE
jgi:hypothetical protein